MWVEIIEDHNVVEFEQRLNRIIQHEESNGFEIVDIKYAYAPETLVSYEYSAMIIYKEGVKNE